MALIDIQKMALIAILQKNGTYRYFKIMALIDIK